MPVPTLLEAERVRLALAEVELVQRQTCAETNALTPAMGALFLSRQPP